MHGRGRYMVSPARQRAALTAQQHQQRDIERHGCEGADVVPDGTLSRGERFKQRESHDSGVGGDGQERQVARRLARRRGKGRADAGAQAQQERKVQRDVRREEEIAQRAEVFWADRVRGGAERVHDELDHRGRIGDGKAARAASQAAEAEEHEHGADAGQDVLEAEQAQPEGHERQAPEDEAHGVAPGFGQLRVHGRQLRGGLGQQELIFAFIHQSSPPSRLRRRFFIR